MLRNIRTSLLFVAGFCFATTCASATNITWYLQNVGFNFNGIGSGVTGSFVYNFDTNTYSSVNLVSTAAGPLTNPMVIFSGGNQLQAVSGTGDLTNDLEIFMVFKSFLTNAGGTIPITLDGVGICQTSNCNSTNNSISFGNGGSLGAVTTTPEPASLLLSATALLAFCAVALRRRLPAVRTQ